MSGIREITEKVCEGEHHSSKVLSAILEKLSRLEDNQEMERLRSVKIVQQNSKILKRIHQIEQFLLSQPKDNAELICRIVENTTAITEMKSTYKETMRELRADNRGKYKQKEHAQKRINLSKPEPGIIPTLDETFYKKLESARTRNKPHNFYYEKPIVDIEKLDSKRSQIIPPMFIYFINVFLKNPQNCAFHKKNDRTYLCRSDNDIWEKEDSNDFWLFIRSFLWDSYVKYVSQMPLDEGDTFCEGIIDKLENIEEPQIPVNKTALIWQLYKKKTLPGVPRLGELLAHAYHSKNKNYS